MLENVVHALKRDYRNVGSWYSGVREADFSGVGSIVFAVVRPSSSSLQMSLGESNDVALSRIENYSERTRIADTSRLFPRMLSDRAADNSASF